MNPSSLSRIQWWLAAAGFLAIVLFIYSSSLGVSFFADDFNFLEPAARLTLQEYLTHYFDPRVQVLWYRPLQGIQILLEYWLFGANALGYHVVQILIHWINGILIFVLVRRIGHHSLVAVLSTLFYISFPVYALAINWINITDPAMTIFYLLGIWFWLNYLDRRVRRDYVLTLGCFFAALFFKQMALTLPANLLLLDLLFYRNDFSLIRFDSLFRTIREFVPRYVAFGGIVLGFFAIQFLTRSTHTFVGVFGYSIGPHIVSILVQYLSLLSFPWGYYPASDTQITDRIPDFIPVFTVVWMFIALAAYFVATVRTHNRALIFLGAGTFVTLLPVLPFPFIELRYLYLPAIFSGVGLALWVERACRGLRRPIVFAVFATIALVLLILGDAAAVANANAEIAEIARQRRVPFRDIASAHPRFPDDTYLYFIDPVSPLPELKGLFALRYGRSLSVSGSDASNSDNWRDHKNTLIYYFDDTGKPREVAVDPHAPMSSTAEVPAAFGGAIILDRVDISSARVKRGEVLIALLSWRASGMIEQDYTVFVHLVDQNRKIIVSYDSPPRKGKLPTREWRLNASIVDPIVLVIPNDAPVGDLNALQIGLYLANTGARLTVQPSGDDAVTFRGLTIE